jgi:hypothetical protein
VKLPRDQLRVHGCRDGVELCLEERVGKDFCYQFAALARVELRQGAHKVFERRNFVCFELVGEVRCRGVLREQGLSSVQEMTGRTKGEQEN